MQFSVGLQEKQNVEWLKQIILLSHIEYDNIAFTLRKIMKKFLY